MPDSLNNRRLRGAFKIPKMKMTAAQREMLNLARYELRLAQERGTPVALESAEKNMLKLIRKIKKGQRTPRRAVRRKQ